MRLINQFSLYMYLSFMQWIGSLLHGRWRMPSVWSTARLGLGWSPLRVICRRTLYLVPSYISSTHLASPCSLQNSVLLYFRLIYNLTHRRMFTSKVWTDDNRLLQESNLAARQPQGATAVIQAITGEGLAQGPCVAARGGVEPTTFRTDNIHLTNHAPINRSWADEIILCWAAKMLYNDEPKKLT